MWTLEEEITHYIEGLRRPSSPVTNDMAAEVREPEEEGDARSHTAEIDDNSSPEADYAAHDVSRSFHANSEAPVSPGPSQYQKLRWRAVSLDQPLQPRSKYGSAFISCDNPPTTSKYQERTTPPHLMYASIPSHLPVGTAVPFLIDAWLDSIVLKADETQNHVSAEGVIKGRTRSSMLVLEKPILQAPASQLCRS